MPPIELDKSFTLQEHRDKFTGKQAPSNFVAGRPKAALLFGSLAILDAVCRYLSLFLLYIDIKNR